MGSADYLQTFLEKTKPGLLISGKQAQNGKSTSVVIRLYRESIHY